MFEWAVARPVEQGFDGRVQHPLPVTLALLNAVLEPDERHLAHDGVLARAFACDDRVKQTATGTVAEGRWRRRAEIAVFARFVRLGVFALKGYLYYSPFADSAELGAVA